MKEKYVLGLFKSQEHADEALSDLNNSGYDHEDIHIIAQEKSVKGFSAEKDTDTDGAVTGASTGAVAGGIAGLLAGIGAIVIPGIGPIISVGTVLGALASTAVGAGVGAAGGGLIGGLVDLGIDEEDAGVYAEGVKRGGILLLVKTDDHNEVKGIMSKHQALDVQTEKSHWSPEDYDKKEFPYL